MHSKPKRTNKEILIGVRVDAAMAADVRRLATHRECTMGAVMRAAMRSYLEQEGLRRVRDRARQ